MKLSVIIVSYNVSHFLEQCLKSVIRASRSLDVDIFVVDNNSEDDSVNMVQTLFPEVKLIVNTDNKGFSKANNQAIQQSESDYILLLNPDTVLEDTTLIRTLVFMETHSEAGGLGIKMLDGQGYFLPESKRGLPTPWAAFCKMSNLSMLFPGSAFFNRYYAGHLPENKINKTEVLAGAFMLLRRKVLDKIGLFDEDFFMYGEDIDLSYRITKAGYCNYYFPDAWMIHYKGESTRKSSLNYVRLFYGAMLIFARKHFIGKNERLLTFIILPGIYFKAILELIFRQLDLFTHSSTWSFFSRVTKKTILFIFGKGLLREPPVENEISLIIANYVEARRIKDLLQRNYPHGVSSSSEAIRNADPGFVYPFEFAKRISLLEDLREKIEQIHPNEIIFSATDLTTDQIIVLMYQLRNYSIPFRIAHTDNNTIIGSNFVKSYRSLKINV